MRAASILLFAGGTALSPAPQTISVAVSMRGRSPMLDQVEIAAICQSRPSGSGGAQRVTVVRPQQYPCYVVGAAGNRSDATRGGQQHQPVHPARMSERDLLRDGTAERKSDDVRCRDTELVQNAHRDVRQHRHRVGNDRSLARAHSRDVKGDHGSAAKRVAEIRPALHRAVQPVEQQDWITEPVIRAATRTP